MSNKEKKQSEVGGASVFLTGREDQTCAVPADCLLSHLSRRLHKDHIKKAQKTFQLTQLTLPVLENRLLSSLHRRHQISLEETPFLAAFSISVQTQKKKKRLCIDIFSNSNQKAVLETTRAKLQALNFLFVCLFPRLLRRL